MCIITSKLQKSQQKLLSITLGVADHESKMTHTGLMLQVSKTVHKNLYLFFHNFLLKTSALLEKKIKTEKFSFVSTKQY